MTTVTVSVIMVMTVTIAATVMMRPRARNQSLVFAVKTISQVAQMGSVCCYVPTLLDWTIETANDPNYKTIVASNVVL